MLPLPLGKTRRASNSLLVIPLPSLLPRIRSLSQTTLLITGTRHSSCSPLLQFPVSSHNYSQQDNHILMWEPEVTSPSWGTRYKVCLPRALDGHSVLEHKFQCGPLRHVVSSSLGLYLGLINCCTSHLFTGGRVFIHSQDPGKESLLHTPNSFLKREAC